MLQIVIKSRSLGSAEQVQISLPAGKDWDLLLSFREYARDLWQTGFLANRLKLNVSLHTETGKAPWASGDCPPDQELWMVFHKLRPFQLNDEATNFSRVSKMLKNHFQGPAFKLLFDHWRDRYLGRWFQKSYPIHANEYCVNSETFFTEYVNAVEYHKDPKRKATLDEISKIFPSGVQRAIIVVLLHSKTSAVRSLEQFIDTIEKRVDGKLLTIDAP